jgi:hypothetical protein
MGTAVPRNKDQIKSDTAIAAAFAKNAPSSENDDRYDHSTIQVSDVDEADHKQSWLPFYVPQPVDSSERRIVLGEPS